MAKPGNLSWFWLDRAKKRYKIKNNNVHFVSRETK